MAFHGMWFTVTKIIYLICFMALKILVCFSKPFLKIGPVMYVSCLVYSLSEINTSQCATTYFLIIYF